MIAGVVIFALGFAAGAAAVLVYGLIAAARAAEREGVTFEP